MCILNLDLFMNKTIYDAVTTCHQRFDTPAKEARTDIPIY
jgi:hypothetical protein